jgi:hypothetical protein
MAGQAQRDPPRVSGARRALFERLIDNAALFPPAALGMDAALEVDRWARSTPEAWMLHRFLVPASKLGAVPANFDVPLGVIVDGELPETLDPRVDTVEARLERAHLLEGCKAQAFLEVWPGDESKLGAVAELCAGAKVRCGGITPDMFPSPGELADFMIGCRERGLKFKATAGLHHPIRDGIVHGFLNLRAAAALAHAGDASRQELIDALLADEPDACSITDDAFRVAGREFGAGQVAAMRQELFVGFGCCSFSEPVEDLKKLWLI